MAKPTGRRARAIREILATSPPRVQSHRAALDELRVEHPTLLSGAKTTGRDGSRACSVSPYPNADLIGFARWATGCRSNARRLRASVISFVQREVSRRGRAMTVA